MKVGALITLLLCGAALAADPPQEDPQLRSVRTKYEYGKFKDALDLAQEQIDRGGLTEPQLIEFHKYAGLAAFELSRMEDAERHFKAMLEKSPDADLDPFAVEPPALRFFEQVRTKNKDLLDVIRRGIRVRADRLRELAEEEERRRRLEQEISTKVTVKTVERRSFLVNFVPFGAGQYQEGRIRATMFFAISEALLAAASVTGWIVRSALATTGVTITPIQTNGGLGSPDGSIPQRGVSARDAFQDSAWRYVQYTSAVGFYVVYAGEVLDAVLHYEDQVVTNTETTTTQPAPSPAPATPAPAKPEAPKSPPAHDGPVPLGPGVRGSRTDSSLEPFFFPTTGGGAGAGVTLRF